MWGLKVLSGPSAGTLVPLGPGSITIGRGKAAGFRVADPGISRDQLVLEVNGETVSITNLSSKVPLVVNDGTVQTATLVPGDRIGFGATRALLVTLDADGAALDPVGVAIRQEIDTLTHEYPSVPGDEQDQDLPARVARDRDLLYRISFQLSRASSEDELRETFVRLICEGTQASRVTLLLQRDGGKRLFAVASSTGDGDPSGAASGHETDHSRTALGEAVRSRKSLLCENVAGNSRLAGQDSVLGGGIESIMVVPLLLDGEVRGALYLDSRRCDRRFTQADLALATALANQAVLSLGNLRRHAAVERAHTTLTGRLREECQITAVSPPMVASLRLLERAAPSDSTVLLRGESGTGKELAASFTHYRSRRAHRSFVAINCAAIPSELIESELFGHVRGAFAGAVETREGRFQQADGGTLFLDEIGEMQTGCQAKLLRVLESREFSPVGSDRIARVDVRIVAGTNRNLEEAVVEGTFRGDLYYRLRVVEVLLPPLRERQEDIPPMIERFITEFNAKLGKRIEGVEDAALVRLVACPWPGNVRELRNAVEMGMIVAEGKRLTVDDLPAYVSRSAFAPALARMDSRAQDAFIARYPEDFDAARRAFEREWLAHQLYRQGGNISRTARAIGLSRASLHRKMAEHGLVVRGRE